MSRSISAIAADISRAWARPNYAAAPYLGAMLSLGSVSDTFGADSAKSVVIYFLCNASTFRGPAAKALKAELKALVGVR